MDDVKSYGGFAMRKITLGRWREIVTLLGDVKDFVDVDADGRNASLKVQGLIDFLFTQDSLGKFLGLILEGEGEINDMEDVEVVAAVADFFVLKSGLMKPILGALRMQSGFTKGAQSV